MKSRPLRFLNEIAGCAAYGTAQIWSDPEELEIFAANAYMHAAIQDGSVPKKNYGHSH
jgi:hypothetical protein